MKMKKLLAAASVALTLSAPALAQTHDADFPDQMRAINQCYVKFIEAGHTPASNADVRTCVEQQDFKFCGDCKIFRYSGGACESDSEYGVHRPTCYRRQSFPAAWQGSWCLTKTVKVSRHGNNGVDAVVDSRRYQRKLCEDDKMILIKGDRFSAADFSCQVLGFAFKVHCHETDMDYDDHMTMSVDEKTKTLSVEFDGELTLLEGN
jgi:hypothetical protein